MKDEKTIIDTLKEDEKFEIRIEPENKIYLIEKETGMILNLDMLY